MEILHWSYNISIDDINDFMQKSYGYRRNDFLVFTWLYWVL